jgi:plasmid maintenance system antidote protein VapI
MATKNGGEMLTAGKLAEALGVSAGKVRKLIQEYEIEPDEIKRGCKYYGTTTLKKLKTKL